MKGKAAVFACFEEGGAARLDGGISPPEQNALFAEWNLILTQKYTVYTKLFFIANDYTFIRRAAR